MSKLFPLGLITAALLLMAQTPPPPSPSVFANADTNHDGKVSKEEFRAVRQARFDRLDKNHDGVIDMRDFPQLTNRKELMAQLGSQIAAADLNRDGSVSYSELRIAGTPLFDRADMNHDGFISQSEMAALRQQLANRKP